MKSVIRMGLCVAALWGGAALAGGDRDRDRPYGGSGRGEEQSAFRGEERGADTGLYVLLGGGAEGYSGSLAGSLNPGPAYGAEIGFKPSKVFGVELGYSGSMKDIDLAGPGGVANGGDIMRNGAHAAATIGLTTTRLQPYVLGGIGIERHDVRGGGGAAFGFTDDTNGFVPAGVGLRYNLGRLITADARVSYNIPFNQEFGPVDSNGLDDGRYQGLLQLGGTY